MVNGTVCVNQSNADVTENRMDSPLRVLYTMKDRDSGRRTLTHAIRSITIQGSSSPLYPRSGIDENTARWTSLVQQCFVEVGRGAGVSDHFSVTETHDNEKSLLQNNFLKIKNTTYVLSCWLNLDTPKA